MLTITRMTKTEPAYVPPSWENGSDAAIVEALEKHYNDEIDLTEYWSVGAERTVHLDKITQNTSSGGIRVVHEPQNVKLVLMNIGGKELATPINGHTQCAFVVGQKDILIINPNDPEGIKTSIFWDGINMPTDTTEGGWNACQMRTKLNENYDMSGYYKAIPSTLISIFKQFKNITANGSSSSTATSIDYFALPAEKEVLCTNSNANPSAESSLSQFEYYETSSNRIKYRGTVASMKWWTRSPVSGSSEFFCCMTESGTSSYNYSSSPLGIAPFGVI